MQTKIYLQDLLEAVTIPEQANIAIQGLAVDSRQVKVGDVFFAYPGEAVDGRNYVTEAIKQGAVAVLVEQELPEISWQQRVPVIGVKHLRSQLSKIASHFYGEPSKKLKVIGVTGTNGKTSCSYFLAQVLTSLGNPCGLIGTLGSGLYRDLIKNNFATNLSVNTTPDPISIQRLLRQFYTAGARYTAMEVSSHSLVQERVKAVCFDTALFTNLTRDHLDYHGSMPVYGAAKRSLFTMPHLKQAVINLDDNFGKGLLAELAPRLTTYSYSRVSPQADVYATETHFDHTGIYARVFTPWGEGELKTALIGQFNLSNLLGVLAVLGSYAIALNTILESFKHLVAVPGRMQFLGGGARPVVVIDYAHTPDALENVLRTLRLQTQGKLWCVFGCGGQRDAGKRPEMGRVAAALADQIVVTSDNPRAENPQAIIDAILQGIDTAEKLTVEPDRARAISYAIKAAQPLDVILIAGKGHESYQEIAGQKYDFSDVVHAKTAVLRYAGAAAC